MATVFRKPNSPYWFAQFYDPATGKRVNRSTKETKRRAAEKVAADLEAGARKRAKDSGLSRKLAAIVETAARDADSGGLTLARAEEMLGRLKKIANPEFQEKSLATAWNEWRALQSGSASMAKGYQEDQKLFATALGQRIMNAPVASLNEQQIRKAMATATASQGGKGRSGKPRKAATVNKALSSLRRMLEWAVNRKMIPANPAKEIKRLSEADSTEKGPFSAEEVRALLDAAPDDEWRGMILLAAHTGLRAGDVVGLGSEHVDGTRIVIRPSKTSKAKKTISVPMSPPVLGWVDGKTGRFFPSLSKLSAAERSMRFRKIMDSANVPRIVTAPGGIVLTRSFHSLRHTFASWLAEADVHADVRQKLTGHSSSRIHQRYTHHDEALDRAVSKLPGVG